MRTRALLSLLCAGAGLLCAVPGCEESAGGGEGAGGSAPAALSPAELCPRLLDAECATFDRCFPGVLKLNHADCVALLDTIPGFSCSAFVDPTVRSVETGRASFDAAGAEACLVELESGSCPGEQWRSLLGRCEPAQFFQGNVGPGDACGSGAECDERGYCFLLIGNCDGVCQSYGLEGDCCAPPCGSAPCAPGLACTATPAGTSTCQQAGSGGCGSRADCAAGERCLVDPATGAGACAPLPVEGEGCAIGEDPPFCAPPLACDGANVLDATGSCALRLPAGSPCKASWSCAEGLACVELDVATGLGSCAAPGARGESCTPAPEDALWPADDCEPTATCNPATSLCEGPPVLGEPCRTSSDGAGGTGCAEGFCRVSGGATTGTCSPLLGEGESCAQSPQACGAGLHCDKNVKQCSGPAPDGAPCAGPHDCASGRCFSNGQEQLCQPAC